MNEENYQGEQIVNADNNHSNGSIPGIKLSNGWKMIFAVLLILFLLSVSLIWKMSHRIDQIQIQLDQYQQMVTNQLNSFNSQIGSIPYNIDESLKKAESIVADYGYKAQPEQIDRKTRTVPIILTVRPKVDKAGLKATFLIETEDGKIITASGKKGEANTYTATALVPIKDYLKLGVTFDDGISQKSEKLEDLYQPFDSIIMKVDSFMSSYGITQTSDKTVYKGNVETTITKSADGKNYPVKATIQFLKNRKLIKTIPIGLESTYEPTQQPQQEAAAVMMGGTSTTYYAELNEELKGKTDTMIEVRVVVEDNYGFRYTQIIDSEMIGKDGSGNTTNYSNEVVIE
jgi:hypothetical protein